MKRGSLRHVVSLHSFTMSFRFSRFLGSKWDRATAKGQPLAKEQEESSLSGLSPVQVLLADDTKGNASYTEVSQESSSTKDTSTDTSKVTLIQDVSGGLPSKSKGL